MFQLQAIGGGGDLPGQCEHRTGALGAAADAAAATAAAAADLPVAHQYLLKTNHCKIFLETFFQTNAHLSTGRLAAA